MNLEKVIPQITAHIPENKKIDGAVIVFAGGGYTTRAGHEGDVYAEFLKNNGICAFNVEYRVVPARFPSQLFDARYAVNWVRENAEKYGIDRNKIAVMGSSAGGHLAAMVSTYTSPRGAQELDIKENYLPNAQILCYPVIVNPTDNSYANIESYEHLLDTLESKQVRSVDPTLNVTETTPQAFIWHTAEDEVVDMRNSLDYVCALQKNKIPVEMHIFQNGPHGIGLANNYPHSAQWKGLLLNWLYKIFG
ncbi:MAG: alpha/beta hydrolase [Clostridia bacterium]|nr:alpha/beta hydrolase [Clostridia bacterium]